MDPTFLNARAIAKIGTPPFFVGTRFAALAPHRPPSPPPTRPGSGKRLDCKWGASPRIRKPNTKTSRAPKHTGWVLPWSRAGRVGSVFVEPTPGSPKSLECLLFGKGHFFHAYKCHSTITAGLQLKLSPRWILSAGLKGNISDVFSRAIEEGSGVLLPALRLCRKFF